ncbi:histone H3-K79 methyltransferase [Phytophthora cactorum]|nr:histone H3-K79 methyltransferase [Phytophthora cactorum]
MNPSTSESQAERSIRDIFSSLSAAAIRQQAGKTDENTGEMPSAALSSAIQIIGNVHQDDVFLDIGAGLGNDAAQFAIQTNVRQCLVTAGDSSPRCPLLASSCGPSATTTQSDSEPRRCR